MNAWEGQVLAIAVKELLESLKTLGREGFGFARKDHAILSAVIRDLLSRNPNVPRALASLKEVESLGVSPLPEYFVAREMLAKIRNTQPPAARPETETPDAGAARRDEAAADRLLTAREPPARRESRPHAVAVPGGKRRSLLVGPPGGEDALRRSRRSFEERPAPVSAVAESREPSGGPDRPESPRDNS